MDIQAKLARNMRNYRKAAGMSQEDLAEKSGVHRTYIGGIEQQRINVSIKNVEKIAKALEIDPFLLFANIADKPTAAQAKTPDAQRAKTSRIKEPKRVLHKDEYAICEWHGDNIEVYPVNVRDQELSVHILATLASRDVSGQDLAIEFERVQDILIDYFDSTLEE